MLCFGHTAGSQEVFQCDVLGIFATVLKVDMWIEESFSMEKVMWKCSGIRDSIASAISAMTEILPESAR